jgi:cytochrome c556
LEAIAESKALCAWLREAIKAKEHLTREVANLSMFEWAKKFDKPIPTQPTLPSMPTKEEIISEYSVGVRNKILTLEAYAAAYGSAVHPDGGLSSARKQLIKVTTSPNKVSGSGRDTIVDKYTPTVDVDKVDELFFAIQKKHRNAQAEYNTIMYEAESTAKDRYAGAMAEYREQSAKFSEEMNQLTVEFNEYVANERRRISNLKIIIPDNLKEIYQNVKNKTK